MLKFWCVRHAAKGQISDVVSFATPNQKYLYLFPNMFYVLPKKDSIQRKEFYNLKDKRILKYIFVSC